MHNIIWCVYVTLHVDILLTNSPDNPRAIWYWSSLDGCENLAQVSVDDLAIHVLSFNWIFHFNYDIKLTMARKKGFVPVWSTTVFGVEQSLLSMPLWPDDASELWNLMPLFWYAAHMCFARRMNNCQNGFFISELIGSGFWDTGRDQHCRLA